MIERMLPLYDEAHSALGRDLANLPPEAKGSAARLKMQSADFLKAIEPVLFPDDADG